MPKRPYNLISLYTETGRRRVYRRAVVICLARIKARTSAFDVVISLLTNVHVRICVYYGVYLRVFKSIYHICKVQIKKNTTKLRVENR